MEEIYSTGGDRGREKKGGNNKSNLGAAICRILATAAKAKSATEHVQYSKV